MQDWPDLLTWFAQQTDLDLADAVQEFGRPYQTALLASFHNYANLAAPPKMRQITDITGRETAPYILLVTQAMPTAPWPRQKTIITNLLLALLRLILVNTPGEKRPVLADYVSTVEADMMRPMVEQGIDRAYLILKQAGVIR
jgi:hypothetical protein